MNRPLIIVAGLGRCGTSMMMQMLSAGGIPCIGRYPAFEDTRLDIGFDYDWLAQQHGYAAKILDPQRSDKSLASLNSLVIWLNRDLSEQAKSMVKFGNAMSGMATDRNAWRVMRKSLAKDGPRALTRLGLGVRPFLELHFENIIFNPSGAALRVATFVRSAGFAFDPAAAASEVRRRSVACYPGLMEVELLEGARA